MAHPSQQVVTRLLAEVESGNAAALDELIPHIYDDLRALAGRIQPGRGDRATLRPTALVHEAYVRILGHGGAFSDRRHFMAVAAMAMRQLLADHARRSRSLKRGGDQRRVELDDGALEAGSPEAGAPGLDLVDLDAALTELAAIEPRQARVVELRFFAGMTVEETAAVVGVAPRTVKLDWQMARARLLRRLSAGER